MFGWDERTHKALRCAFALSTDALYFADGSFKQIQDVKDKLKDLIPWVAKLEETLTKTNAEDSEEVERQTQLRRSASHIHSLTPPN